MGQKLKGKHPVVGRRKKNFPFQVAAVCWVDLLGYGAMIADANFNPLDARSKSAVKRLRSFHEIVARHSGRYFPTLTINDGAAAYRDISLRNRSVGHDFLMRSWKLLQDLNAEELKNGFPGARMVLATGFRMLGRKAGIVHSSRLFESVMERFQAGTIGAEQAIREAAKIRQPFDIVPQLQANFAFTKAYLAENGGKAAGFPGNSFFVDAMLFEGEAPPWIVSGSVVDWSHPAPQMEGRFFRVDDVLPWKHPEGGPAEMRDGLEIAKHLSHDENVLYALHNAEK